jgi:hypothetical protein
MDDSGVALFFWKAHKKHSEVWFYDQSFTHTGEIFSLCLSDTKPNDPMIYGGDFNHHHLFFYTKDSHDI